MIYNNDKCKRCNAKMTISCSECYESLQICSDCCYEYHEAKALFYFDFMDNIIQPERSKREDSYCCEILIKLKYIFQGDRLLTDVRKYVEDLIKDCEMRCSEHCGNTMRDK